MLLLLITLCSVYDVHWLLAAAADDNYKAHCMYLTHIQERV